LDHKKLKTKKSFVQKKKEKKEKRFKECIRRRSAIEWQQQASFCTSVMSVGAEFDEVRYAAHV